MIHLTYSEKFYKLIFSELLMNNFIAYVLKNGYDMFDSSSYIEIEGEDIISFIPDDKMSRLYKEYKKNGGEKDFERWSFSDDNAEMFYTKHRTNIKIGRFLTKIFNNKKNKESIDFALTLFKKIKPDFELNLNKEIESFVNIAKAIYKQTNDKQLYSKISLVSGEDIRKFYLEENYHFVKGSLGRSCMRGEEQQDFLDIYVDNSEICQMLVMKEGEKIIMRALLWTLESGKKYLDRIYATNESDAIIFMNYAKEQGWSMYNSDFKNNKQVLSLKIKWLYDEYPYMDTFRFLDADNLTINTFSQKGMYDLTNQDGTIELIDFD